MSPHEVPSFVPPPDDQFPVTRKYWLPLAGIAAVVLGAWSLWLVKSTSFNSATSWPFAKSSAEVEPDLLFDDDRFEPIPTPAQGNFSSREKRSVVDRGGDSESVERAVHVTMTGVAEEIMPVDFQSSQPVEAKHGVVEESPAGAWLTGEIETLEDPAERPSPVSSEIPAWRRRSKPLKTQPNLPRGTTGSVRD